MAVNLYVSHYNEPNRERRTELETCLMNNLKSGCFDKVWVIAENDKDGKVDYLANVEPYSINVLPCTVRPTFRTFFEVINRVSKEDDINILANADIYFESASVLPRNNQVFALTRYDVKKNGPITFLNRRDSQDSWWFRGHVRYPKYCDFHQIPGCDNRIAAELLYAGYEVLNPSLTIKTFHLHAGEKSYDGSVRVQRPYHFIAPIELNQ